MKKFVDISLKITIVFFVLFSLIIFSAFWYFSAGLPDYKKLAKYQPPVSSRVYAKNGVLIAEYAVEKRIFIPRKLPCKCRSFAICKGLSIVELVEHVLCAISNCRTSSPITYRKKSLYCISV